MNGVISAVKYFYSELLRQREEHYKINIKALQYTSASLAIS